MKVSVQYYLANGATKEVAGDTMSLVSQILTECVKFDYKVDIKALIEKSQLEVEKSMTSLGITLVKLGNLCSDKVNYTLIDKESAATKAEETVIECKSMVFDCDITNMIKGIGQAAVLANLAFNLDLVELMILANQGEQFAMNKLMAISKENLLDSTEGKEDD